MGGGDLIKVIPKRNSWKRDSICYREPKKYLLGQKKEQYQYKL